MVNQVEDDSTPDRTTFTLTNRHGREFQMVAAVLPELTTPAPKRGTFGEREAYALAVERRKIARAVADGTLPAQAARIKVRKTGPNIRPPATPKCKPFTVEPWAVGDWIEWDEFGVTREGQIWAVPSRLGDGWVATTGLDGAPNHVRPLVVASDAPADSPPVVVVWQTGNWSSGYTPHSAAPRRKAVPMGQAELFSEPAA
jgi:hypothetical protein